MPGLIYFIETDKGTITAAEFARLGLAHALAGPSLESCQTHDGPGGKKGLIVAPQLPGKASAAPKFRKSTQTWRRGASGWHVGFDNSARPGPSDLAREKIYTGASVRLRDGNDWIVPRCVAILEDRPPTLPYVFDVGDDGEILARIEPRFDALCKSAFDLWLHFSRQTDRPALDAAQQVRLACEALAVNYRLGTLEAVGLLGLIGTEERTATLRAIIDADEVEAYFKAETEKKSESPANESAISCGSPEDASPGEPVASASPP